MMPDNNVSLDSSLLNELETVFNDKDIAIASFVDVLDHSEISEKEKVARDVAGAQAVGVLRKLNTRNHKEIRLKLGDIFYGHKTINDRFGSLKRGFHKSIWETIEELRNGATTSDSLWRDLGYIEVMKKQGRYYAIGGNRRLYCLKEVYDSNFEVFVHELPYDDVVAKWKITTTTNGESVWWIHRKRSLFGVDDPTARALKRYLF